MDRTPHRTTARTDARTSGHSTGRRTGRQTGPVARARLLRALAVAGGVGLASLAWAQPGDDAALPRPQAIEALVNSEFPTSLWSGLSLLHVPESNAVPVRPSGDDADDSASVLPVVNNKAVLLVLFDPSDRASVETAGLTQRVMARYADHGVTVLGVVPGDQAETARGLSESGGLTMVTAADTKGGVFDLLRHEAGTVQFAVLDHGHTLRSGDVPRRQLRPMITRLVLDHQEAQRDAEEAERRGTPTDPSGSEPSRPGNPLAVLGDDHLPAEESAYESARWPRSNPSVERVANNLQGRALPVAPGRETWLSPDVDTEGRAIVLDFWATWCGPCLAAEPRLETLQSTFKDELLIVGVSGQSRGSAYPEDEPAIRRFLANKQGGAKYAHAHDPDQRVYRSLGIRAIPHVVVLSSDGVVRWQGNPLSDDFLIAVQQVVRVDPGVAARRAGTLPERDAPGDTGRGE